MINWKKNKTFKYYNPIKTKLCDWKKKKFALSKVLLLLKLKVYSSEYFYKFTQYVFPLLSHITSSHHLNIYFYLIYLIWCCCLSIGEVFCCVPPLHNITFPVMLVCVISPRHTKVAWFKMHACKILKQKLTLKNTEA